MQIKARIYYYTTIGLAGEKAQFYQRLMKLHSNKDYQMLKEVQTKPILKNFTMV